MAFRPLGDRVLVKRVEEESKTKGGIIIPDTAKEKPQEGEVVAVGPGRFGDSGDRLPVDDPVLVARAERWRPWRAYAVLQLWREDDRNAWALYQVADATRARDYLQGAAGVFNSRAGVLSADYHFVETV